MSQYRSWMEEAAHYLGRKVSVPEYAQAYALMAIAEALHRLASAIEGMGGDQNRAQNR